MGLRIQRGKFAKTRLALFVAIVIALLFVPFSTHIEAPKAYADPTAPRFINSPHYVRANVPGDEAGIAAEVEFYEGTTQIDFSIDSEATPRLSGSPETYGATPGANKINLHIGPLTPGIHTISGKAVVNGVEMQVQGGPAIIHALDPSIEYVSPTNEAQTFKGSINPVKVKIDDTQFTSVGFQLFKGTPESPGDYVETFTLSKDQCDSTDDGLLYCNIDQASNWTNLSEGTYFVKLKKSTETQSDGQSQAIDFDNQTYWSRPFVIDNTAPAATIGGPFSVVGGEDLTLKGTVDSTAVAAKVYIDGKESGAATIDANTWTFNIPTDLDLGDHQVGIVAEDAAGNESTLDTATTTLTIKPFIPPVSDVTSVVQAAVGLTDPFPVIKDSDVNLKSAAIAKAQESDIATLKTPKDPAVDQNAVAIQSTPQGWKLFGIAWYWFVVLPVGIGAAVWGFGKFRRSSDALPAFITDPEDV